VDLEFAVECAEVVDVTTDVDACETVDEDSLVTGLSSRNAL
jgi:hypothetical protein